MTKPGHKRLGLSGIGLWLSAFLFVFLSFFHLPVNAQPDIQADTTAGEQDTTVKYLTPWEYAFMMNEETSWLFKTDIILTDKLTSNFSLGIEKRIFPGFTLNLEIKYLTINKSYYKPGSKSG